MVKQVGLLSAGCQPWNHDVCASSEDRFAYCATMAIYVYELDVKFNEFKLVSIMTEHKKTITAISWNPRDRNIIASSSADHKIIVWDVAKQKKIALLENTRELPRSVNWSYHELDCVAFISGRGPLYLWYHNTNKQVVPVKETQGFVSNVCQFRWHRKNVGKVAFGHEDGSISVCLLGSKSQKHIFQPEPDDDDEEEDPVTSLEWDPLSMEYLLIANKRYGVRLVDTASLNVIMMFQLPSAAAHIQSLAWIPNAPGMFVTGDSRGGILRLWNVSKMTPIENIKVKQTGFHALQVIESSVDNSLDEEEDVAETTINHISSTSQTLAPTSTTHTRFALPPARVVCTFLDGGVGLYDLGRRKWNFLRDQGHIETIFDCKFKPDNPDWLATGSFDGTVKIWDINTLQAVHTSAGNEGIIYNISWAPGDLNCIAGCTGKNGVFVWDISRTKIIKRFTEHGKGCVYSVAWNPKDSRHLMSCGADGYCIIRQLDGKIVQKYKHPAAVYGCDWSPHNKDMLATGCEDKKVRVYYITSSSDQPLKVFSGHTAKVFHIRWSPLREGILCSGADDHTIRIWDYTKEQCINVLSGHDGPVRGLMWNSEVPYILMSGSWDSSIRVWDTRDGACIDTVCDHGADVYGLTCHPSRPFILASCSRDSTVRLWSLTSLIEPIQLNLICSRQWTDVIGTPESAMSLGTPPLLTGKASKELKQQIEELTKNNLASKLQLFSKFFMQPQGTVNLWELVSVVNGLSDSLLSDQYKNGIMHIKHLTLYKSSEAQELEMIKMSKFGGGIGTPSKDERLLEAARIYIKLGNIQRYCELMVDVGEWEKALSVAPGVSMKYWKSLSQRYSDYLVKKDSESCVSYCVALGNYKQLVKYFTKRGQLSDAILTAQAAAEGSYPPEITSSSNESSYINGCTEESSTSSDAMQLVIKSMENLGEQYYRRGSPTLAACCHLAVGNIQNAMSTLIRGHELELAVSVGIVLGDVIQYVDYAVQLLSTRCERLGKWDLAIDMLKTMSTCDRYIVYVCIKCAASMDEINSLHTKAGLPSMDECLVKGRELQSTDILESVKYHLLSTAPETGLKLGLVYIKDKMSNSNWQCNDVKDMLQLISCIQTEKLHQHQCSQMKDELLTLSCYIGALEAIRQGYHSIVASLLTYTRYCLQRNVDVPLTDSQVSSELEVWKTYYHAHKKRTTEESTSDEKSIYHDLWRKAGKKTCIISFGPDCVASSQLPSHSDVHISCLTDKRILGLAYFLEDGKTAMSINEAIMWAKVNPFSPLLSGVRLNPF
ncbi:hypothetical protein SNE40_017251 [Patella caerulea]|uniref:WD repeat-containing protein 17 n=2 Tax=Patella caerulea TaxID=87958 RepID=A0AAN8JDF8_PATCE